jgi:hypothetical protein
VDINRFFRFIFSKKNLAATGKKNLEGEEKTRREKMEERREKRE